MARWTASAKWAVGPALDGQRDMPLALRLSEGLGVAAVSAYMSLASKSGAEFLDRFLRPTRAGEPQRFGEILEIHPFFLFHVFDPPVPARFLPGAVASDVVLTVSCLNPMLGESPLPTCPVNRLGECLTSHSDFIPRFVGWRFRYLKRPFIERLDFGLGSHVSTPLCSKREIGAGLKALCGTRRVIATPNVGANRPAEAGGVSLARDSGEAAARQAYTACRSGSG